MSTTYYQLYRDDIFALARSMVIKHSGVAEVLNVELQRLNVFVDPDDPTTWKYYKNLNGEYHETDQMITVRSMDTLETIEFTKANLEIHRATRREYLPGGRFYFELLDQYPNQVDLIHGILFPVNKQTAIDADDGTILFYDRNLVETNEDNLIRNTQRWLYSTYAHWYNQQYLIIDDLYLPAFIGIVAMQLPGVIERQRLRNTKTRYVHSFHVREYLASHGRLDRYMPYLNKGQQLWLYRNIRYVQRHVGKQEVFHTLIDQLLTPRSLPLQGYHLNHLYGPLQEDTTSPDSIMRPDVEMTKDPINVDYIQGGRPSETVETILNRQIGLTRGNGDNVVANAEMIERRMKRDQFSRLPTKVLESEIVDRSNSAVRSRTSVLINEWLHLVTNGRYTGFITITQPATGELISLTVKEAFITALYAFMRLNGIETNTIPTVYAYDVLRTPVPLRTELLSIIDQRYMKPAMVDEIRDRLTPHGRYNGPDAFHEACRRLHREYLKVWELQAFQPHLHSRAMCNQVFRRHFMNIKCRLVETPQSFDDWFVAKGMPFMDLGDTDLGQLMVDCINESTGASLIDERSIAEIQRAMLALLGELSSYSVHYLQNINTEDFRKIPTAAIRIGDIAGESEHTYKDPTGHPTVKSLSVARRYLYRLPKRAVTPSIASSDSHVHVFRVKSDVGVRSYQDVSSNYSVNTGTIGVTGYQGVVDSDTLTTNELPHYTPPSND